MRIVQAHLATMERINVQYDLLPRESEILHLHFWEKAYQLLKDRGAIYYVDEGKNSGCWVMNTADSQTEATREEAEDDEKIIVRSDGTVTYVGKDIAYQLWKLGLLGLDFHYKLIRHAQRPRTLDHDDAKPQPAPRPPHSAMRTGSTTSSIAARRTCRISWCKG